MPANARNMLVLAAIVLAVGAAVAGAVLLMKKKEGYDGKRMHARHRRGMAPCTKNGQCLSGQCVNGRCACKYPAGSNQDATGECLPGYKRNRCGGCYPASMDRRR